MRREKGSRAIWTTGKWDDAFTGEATALVVFHVTRANATFLVSTISAAVV
jgi:hypothetical protein